MGKKIGRMAGKVAGPRGSWRRRWSIVLSLVIAVGLAMVVKQNVLAVHDLTFELEGNTYPDGTNPPLGVFDWDDIFDVDADGLGVPKAQLPSGFEHAVFVRDFGTRIVKGSVQFAPGDPSTYATGSKDTLPISTGAQTWQCTQSNNVTDKDDILNAYAATYTDPSTGDEILYFGMERNANNGDANFGFWFLQDEVGCVSAGGATNFVGQHQTGDLFIVSAFSNGGTVSTITVYQWIGDNDTGGLDDTPVASGVDCRTGAPAEDPACGAANTAGITLQWLTSEKTDGVGNTLRTAEFFEGGLNLSDSGLGGKCFNTFVGNTRSSTSLTATIFDFAGGTLGSCTSTTETTPSITSPTPIPADASLDVTDTAKITVDGVDEFDGSVTFFLCGPAASQALADCASGGVEISTETITDAPGKNVAPGFVEKTSDAAEITSAGHYCWRAEFTSTTEGVPGSSDARANECFEITPLTPTLDTNAGDPETPEDPPVAFGDPVTDTATLTGTANFPGSGGPAGSNGTINPTAAGASAGGFITFTLYKEDCTTVATGTGTNPQTVSVSGDGTYGPVEFIPDGPGTYHWVASYDPDDPIVNPNTNPDSHNTDCSDTDESVTVEQIPTEIKTQQSWFPNDTATITSTKGVLPAGGTVVFELYDSATCTGTVVYDEEFIPVGGSATETFVTNNTTVAISTAYADAANSIEGPYSWKVVYTPGSSTHTGKRSSCTAGSTEKFSIEYTNDPGPGTDLP